MSGKSGQIIAAAFVFFGVAIIVISRDFLTGTWSVVIGLSLFDSASRFVRRANAFEGLIVEDIMELPATVSPDMLVMECIDRVVPFNRQIIFPVAADRQLYGFLILSDVKNKLPRKEWNSTHIRDIMRPVKEEMFVESKDSVTNAVALLNSNGLGALGVIDNEGNLVGFVRRGSIRRHG